MEFYPLVVLKKIASEGMLYLGYLLGAAVIFGTFFFLILMFFISLEDFSRIVVHQDFHTMVNNDIFVGSLAIAGVLLYVTLWTVFRKTQRLSVRILRLFVLSVLLLASYISSLPIAIAILQKASLNPVLGKTIPYEKRCLVTHALMAQIMAKNDPSAESPGVSGYVVDDSCQAVFYYGDYVDGADWQSFQEIDHTYAKDAYQAYIYGRPIPGSDAKTFSVMETTGDSNTRMLAGHNVYQAHDDRFVYGIRLNGKSTKDPFFSMEKDEAFLRGVLFPGVEELGHCSVFRKYDGKIIYRDWNKFGVIITDDQFTKFSPLSSDFDYDRVHIRETDDCSQVEVSDGKTSRRYEISN